MGRRKIQIKRIECEKKRQATFIKRKTGLMKKAMELSILCGSKVSLVIDHQGEISRYESHDKEKITTDLENYNFLNNEDYQTLFKEQEKTPMKETPPPPKISTPSPPLISPGFLSTQYKPILPISLPTGVLYYTLQLNPNQPTDSSNQPQFILIPSTDPSSVTPSLNDQSPSSMAPPQITSLPPQSISTEPDKPEDVPIENTTHLNPSISQSTDSGNVEKIGDGLRIAIPDRTALVFPGMNTEQSGPVSAQGVFTLGDSFLTPFSSLGTPHTPNFISYPNF